MASILRPLAVIAQAIKVFFRADIRVRRGKCGLEVVLDGPAANRGRVGEPSPAQPDAAARKEQQELLRVQTSLARLLDELPNNRVVLRHLAFIEHALARKGMRGLDKVPYDVLERALEQFERVVINWSDEGLALLRSKMAVVLIEREAQAHASRRPAAASHVAEEVDTAPLAHPVTLDGEAAAEAEAALLAAYGEVVLPGLNPASHGDAAAAAPPQAERPPPLAKTSAKAVRRGDDIQTRTRQDELQT